MKPYPYQEEAVTSVIAKLQNANTLLIAPTGAGKTFVASMVANHYAEQGQRVLWLVPFVALLSQTYTDVDRFEAAGAALLHGQCRKTIEGDLLRNIIKPDGYDGFRTVPENLGNVLITSAETFNNQFEYDRHLGFTPDLVIIDEAHKGVSEQYQMVRKKFPKAKVLGLTATPSRPAVKDEAERLTKWYKEVVQIATIRELIELGQLVQPVYVDGYDVNTDNVVDVWLKETELAGGENRRTVVFADGIEHAKKLTNAFNDRGIQAERVISEADGEMSATISHRYEIFKRFREGETEVLVSVQALCEGFDEKLARFCLLLRNIGGQAAITPVNRALYQQIVGRVLRSHPNKNDAYVIDFCQNVQNYGKVEDWEWNLKEEDERARIGHTRQISNKGKIEIKDWTSRARVYHTCQNCGHVYDIKKHTHCPSTNCGTGHGQTIVFTAKYMSGKLARWNGKTSWRGWELVKRGSDLERMQDLVRVAEKKRLAEDGLSMNKTYGVDIFETNTEFTEEFKWIESVLKRYKAGFEVKDPNRLPISKMTDGSSFTL